jgi:hypothetical protein
MCNSKENLVVIILPGLVKSGLKVIDGSDQSRVEDRAEVGRLIDHAADDVVISQGRHSGRRVALLLADDVENGLLDVQQDEFYALHLLQLVHAGPLHPQDLIVAGAIVEGVGLLSEIVHNIVLKINRIKNNFAQKRFKK